MNIKLEHFTKEEELLWYSSDITSVTPVTTEPGNIYLYFINIIKLFIRGKAHFHSVIFYVIIGAIFIHFWQIINLHF